MSLEWAVGLDMARGSLKTGGALIEIAVNVNVFQFPTLEAGFMVSGVIIGKGCIIVAASPPDFSVGDGVFFFLGQERG